MVRRTEEEQFAYLKRVMPIAAVCLTVATFIIIPVSYTHLTLPTIYSV